MGAETARQDTEIARRIFRFLAEAEQTRLRPIRTLSSAHRKLWFSELPTGSDYVASGLLDPDQKAWLRIKRIHQQEPPAVPEVLEPWITLSDLYCYQNTEPPKLRERITDIDLVDDIDDIDLEAPREIFLDDHEDRDQIRRAYASWSAQWMKWAERERETAEAVRHYETLYRMREEMEDLGESYELVLGFGYLTWKSDGKPVGRHLVTRKMVITLDDTGALTLAPDPETPGLVLEEDMLDPDQRVSEEVRESITAELDQGAAYEGVEGLEHLHTALQKWSIEAAADAHYSDSLTRHADQGTEAPRISFAPALILRERPRDNQLKALREITKRLETCEDLTPLLRFLTGADDDRSSHSLADVDDEDKRATPAREPYFALPSNQEQRSIAERLDQSHLVVVQGPPGTGKTHTIANLVTDLLAQGKKVLITSHTARALRVLKEKLPEEIQALCVSRTGDGVEAQEELEKSVRAILERRSDFSPKQSKKEIRRLEEHLDKTRRERAEVLRRLREIREQETYHFSPEIGDYQGSLQDIAERLAAEEPRYRWIGTVSQPQPALTAADALALLRAARNYTPEQRKRAADVPAADQLPTPTEFRDAVHKITEAEKAAQAAEGLWEGEADAAIRSLSPERCADITAAVEAFVASRDITARLSDRWQQARNDVLAGRDRRIREQHAQIEQAIAAAEQKTAEVGDARITGLDTFPLDKAAEYAVRLHDGLAAGEQLRGLFGMRTRLGKEVREFVETVRVDGKEPTTADTAALVRARVEAEQLLAETEEEWLPQQAAGNAWKNPRSRIAALRDDLDGLAQLVHLADTRARVATETATVPGLAVLDWADPTAVDTVRLLLTAATAEHAASPARQLVDRALTEIQHWEERGAVSDDLRQAQLALEKLDPDAYEHACASLAETRAAAQARQAYQDAYATVDEAHPTLARAIAETYDDTVWDERLPELEKAWAWSAWNTRLAELTDPEAEDRCRAKLSEADSEIRTTMRRLAAALAWDSCLRRLTQGQEVALRSYQQSVRKIGKGTGKYAPRYQRQAQESLRECRPAVPAWIMPMYQVVATIPMDTPRIFDVVIIDEASQSGPEAMLLAWIADRIVVVGDDKQVSPANVGLDREQLFRLQERLLADLSPSRRNLFSPDRSFFDITSGLAGGPGQLMLKEHFRCMPEIIGFSNELCYQGQLQPLRQYGADRLPPLKTVYVPGVVEGSGQRQINRLEAERLVGQIIACCNDPAYEGRSMGVITLLGHAQQTLIEDLLAERLPFDERSERRIRVGSPAAFQGDERDVIFISMVVSREGTDGPRRLSHFSAEGNKQAINVAASRARDQVWVFHSVSISDLGQNDLRRAYLEYLNRPLHLHDGTGIGDVSPDVRQEPFDSLFEQRVFLALRDRGYRVYPQYQVGRYRIDLVVEGGSRRLAVECDGDAYHNEENAAEDAARQRELERVGWTFVRIRGSRFFRDPEAALQPLWQRLAELDIRPMTLPAETGSGM